DTIVRQNDNRIIHNSVLGPSGESLKNNTNHRIRPYITIRNQWTITIMETYTTLQLIGFHPRLISIGNFYIVNQSIPGIVTQNTVREITQRIFHSTDQYILHL